MALVVRNTFLDFNQEEDSLQHARSSSAPPTCRHKGDYNSAVSATCETFMDTSTEHSTAASDVDDFVSGSSNSDQEFSDHEYEDVSPPMTSYDSDSDDDNMRSQRPAPLKPGPLNGQPEAAVQEQLEQMSQMVMDIWSKLRAVEAQCAEPEKPTKVAVDSVSTTAVSVSGQHAAATKLDVKAPLFTPCCTTKTTDVQDVLASVREMVMWTEGVAGAEVSLGPAGTLATISIQMQSSAQHMHVKNVMASAKSALLEAAANSQSTYVLGYEAEPFKDDRAGSSFNAALVTMPSAWECSACWDTYTRGSCPRRKTCKWQHPGRNELQPVRVIVF